MRSHADGSYAGAPAAMRRGKGLVEVQVADVRADGSGVGQSYLGVHIGSVHVDLCAAGVDYVADFHNVRLEDAVCGRVGNHQCGQVVAVFFGFAAQVFHIHIPAFVAGAGNGCEPGLYGAGGIRPVGAGRDEDFVAVPLADAFQVGPDGAQTGVFARRARVGLEADAGETGDGLQLFAQVMDEFLVALSLVAGHQGVYAGESCEAQGEHLGGGVELHRARAERNHGVGQRYVLAVQAFDVAHHLRLGVVEVEDLVGQVGSRAAQGFGDAAGFGQCPGGSPVGADGLAEECHQLVEGLIVGSLVDAEADGAVGQVEQVDLMLQGDFAQGFLGDSLGQGEV